jgi:hypothetical protein
MLLLPPAGYDYSVSGGTQQQQQQQQQQQAGRQAGSNQQQQQEASSSSSITCTTYGALMRVAFTPSLVCFTVYLSPNYSQLAVTFQLFSECVLLLLLYIAAVPLCRSTLSWLRCWARSSSQQATQQCRQSPSGASSQVRQGPRLLQATIPHGMRMCCN